MPPIWTQIKLQPTFAIGGAKPGLPKDMRIQSKQPHHPINKRFNVLFSLSVTEWGIFRKRRGVTTRPYTYFQGSRSFGCKLCSVRYNRDTKQKPNQYSAGGVQNRQVENSLYRINFSSYPRLYTGFPDLQRMSRQRKEGLQNLTG